MRCCSRLKLWPQGMPFYLPLGVLFLQTTMPLLIRHTRRPSLDGSPQYHPASVTLLAEVVKCCTAFAFIMRGVVKQRPSITMKEAVTEASHKFFRAIWRLSALLLPSVLYFASNITAMHALSHLRSYIFTAIMNARIVFAALLSTCLLNKSINCEQWRAIIIIFCAATVLCLEDMQTLNPEGEKTWTEESFGMFIALGAAGVSAGGGVLVEKFLNTPTSVIQSLHPGSGSSSSSSTDEVGAGGRLLTAASSSSSSSSSSTAAATATSAGAPAANTSTTDSASTILWEQQGVLALFSAGMADLYVLLFLHDAVQERRLMEGWTGMTVVVMLMQALQGILVAMCIQKCGIIFRLILGTISICLCIVIEGILFFEPVVFREVLSIIMVIVGSNMYATAAQPIAAASSASSAVTPCRHCQPHTHTHKEKDQDGAVLRPLMPPLSGPDGTLATRSSRRRYSPTPA